MFTSVFHFEIKIIDNAVEEYAAYRAGRPFAEHSVVWLQKHKGKMPKYDLKHHYAVRFAYQRYCVRRLVSRYLKAEQLLPLIGGAQRKLQLFKELLLFIEIDRFRTVLFDYMLGLLKLAASRRLETPNQNPL